MSRPRTRMADIAALAGVSTATVSRVVSGTGQVSEDTRHKVLVALDSLGYERPTVERSGNSSTIAVITPELVNPIFALYAHSMQTEITHAGSLPLICTQTPGGTTEEQYVRSLLDHGVAGIVFVSGRHADYRADISRYDSLAASGVPFVTVNGARTEVPAPDFSTGDAMGIEAAVHHLVQLGHRRIALLGGHTHIVPAARKSEAFRQVMERELGDTDPLVTETFYTYEAAASAARELVEAGTTAIVAGSDLQALGAARTIHAMGLRVPEDVSLVGFDDSMLMGHLDPPLTTVRQPVQAITTAAVRALTSMEPGSRQEHQAYVYTPDLVVRGSTGQAPDRAASDPRPRASHTPA